MALSEHGDAHPLIQRILDGILERLHKLEVDNGFGLIRRDNDRADVKVLAGRVDELEARCWWCGFARAVCGCRKGIAKIVQLEERVNMLEAAALRVTPPFDTELGGVVTHHDHTACPGCNPGRTPERTPPVDSFAPVVELVRAARDINPTGCSADALVRLLKALKHFEGVK